MQDLCKNTTDINAHYDKQASLPDAAEATEVEFEAEFQLLRKDRFCDATDYDTKDAFDACIKEWEEVAALPIIENVFELTDAQQKHQLVILNRFKFAMEEAFRNALYETAIHKAREKAQEIIDNE